MMKHKIKESEMGNTFFCENCRMYSTDGEAFALCGCPGAQSESPKDSNVPEWEKGFDMEIGTFKVKTQTFLPNGKKIYGGYLTERIVKDFIRTIIASEVGQGLTRSEYERIKIAHAEHVASETAKERERNAGIAESNIENSLGDTSYSRGYSKSGQEIAARIRSNPN